MADVFVWIGVWAIALSLIYSGAVDFVLWALKMDRPRVSDWIHYYLNLYPWVGWLAAGLVYHLLVDRPAPPLR